MRDRQPDFSGLWHAVNQMGARSADFAIEQTRPDLDPLDLELDRGLELTDLDKVGSYNGILSYEGRQVLLYIQDHGRGVVAALNDPKEGRRFHIADCKTLGEMRAKNRFERYVIQNNTDGDFYISGEDPDTGKEKSGKSRLLVCKNCLDFLNYENARHNKSSRIAAEFNIGKFFSECSSFFSELPTRFGGEGNHVGYTDDWQQVATRVKSSSNYFCQSCFVDLSGMKRLLHAHHRNGVKSDNRASNLQALCAACHREQAMHGHMFVSHQDMQMINRLRREQNLLGKKSSWDDALAFCDPALHGVLFGYQSMGKPPPEIAHTIQDPCGKVVATLEIAWPSERRGVAISDEDRDAAQAHGWDVQTMLQALSQIPKANRYKRPSGRRRR